MSPFLYTPVAERIDRHHSFRPRSETYDKHFCIFKFTYIKLLNEVDDDDVRMFDFLKCIGKSIGIVLECIFRNCTPDLKYIGN